MHVTELRWYATCLQDRCHNKFVIDYPHVLLAGKPPQHHRFNDSRIPAHVTWAYIPDARIVRNDEFYEMPEGANKTIDLLFLMANAPVPTLSLPRSGSEAYAGLANVMKLATEELSKLFPGLFGESTQHCKG